MYDEIPEAALRRPTPYVAGGAGGLHAELLLSTSVIHVVPGTILKPGPTGWEVAPDGHGEMIAGSAAYGGERVKAYRQALVEFPPPPMGPKPAAVYGRVSISSTEDSGYVHLVQDPAGPFIRLGPTTVLFDMSEAAMFMALQALSANPDPREPPD